MGTVVRSSDPNSPQPKRADFGEGHYETFRRADKAWNKRERKRRKLAAAHSEAAAQPAYIVPADAGADQADGFANAGAGPSAGGGGGGGSAATELASGSAVAPAPAEELPAAVDGRGASGLQHSKPHGPVPKFGGEACLWDWDEGCWGEDPDTFFADAWSGRKRRAMRIG